MNENGVEAETVTPTTDKGLTPPPSFVSSRDDASTLETNDSIDLSPTKTALWVITGLPYNNQYHIPLFVGNCGITSNIALRRRDIFVGG